MKTIHARIGMSVKVTDEQFDEIMELSQKYYDVDDFPEWLEEKFKTEGIMFDAESYIPGPWLEEEPWYPDECEDDE